ncbi:MAG: phospholipase D family protein [Thermodesulfobacteriota bacterium]
MKGILVLVVVLWGGVALYQRGKPLPVGLSLDGPRRPGVGVRFLADRTFERDGRVVSEQVIFAHVCRLIDEARHFVILDFFLFNNLHGQEQPFLPLTEELTRRIIAKRQRAPQVEMVLITDEINRQYGAYEFEHLQRLREAGVRVVYTDLTRLRDSNPLYSAWWRLCCQWLGSEGQGWLASPFAANGPRFSLSAYLNLLNFKANHRKVVVNEAEALVTSANPHDASSWHSNVGLLAAGQVVGDIVASEAAVAAMSDQPLPRFQVVSPPGPGDGTEAQVLTEGKIKARLLAAIGVCGPADQVELAMFYLSDREVIEALLAAAARGSTVRLLLDPNRDAFGRAKNGIPNRPVASELVRRSGGRVQVRWHRTHGEQFHSKLALVCQGERVLVMAGSANLTRRNLGDLNLETDLAVEARGDAEVVREARDYFQRLWENRDGQYSEDFAVLREDSPGRLWLYRFQEWSGMSTF